MDSWQQLRLKRAVEQNIYVTHVECAEDDSFVFIVQGVNDVYAVHISQDVDLWPPLCDCEDNCWRPDILCKHILTCLAVMGVEAQFLEDCCWEPSQQELIECLFRAPDCVGCSISKHAVREDQSDSRAK